MTAQIDRHPLPALHRWSGQADKRQGNVWVFFWESVCVQEELLLWSSETSYLAFAGPVRWDASSFINILHTSALMASGTAQCLLGETGGASWWADSSWENFSFLLPCRLALSFSLFFSKRAINHACMPLFVTLAAWSQKIHQVRVQYIKLNSNDIEIYCCFFLTGSLKGKPYLVSKNLEEIVWARIHTRHENTITVTEMGVYRFVS